MTNRQEILTEIYNAIDAGESYANVAKYYETSHQLIRYHLKRFCAENDLKYPQFKRGPKQHNNIFKKIGGKNA